LTGLKLVSVGSLVQVPGKWVYFDQRFQRFGDFSDLWTISGLPCPAPLNDIPFFIVDAGFPGAFGIHSLDDHSQHLGIRVQVEIRDFAGKNLICPGESISLLAMLSKKLTWRIMLPNE